MKYRLQDLVDIAILQEMLNKLRESIPLAFSIIDMDGNYLARTPMQEICSKFHRVNSASQENCLQSDSLINAQLELNQDNLAYSCPHGLVDSVTPIIIDGEYMANLILGQLFLQPPDEQHFRQQARRFGYDEDKYIEALHKVPVITKAELDKNHDIMRIFTVMLGEIGMKRMGELKALETVKQSNEKLRQVGSYNRSLIEANTDAMAVVGSDGKITDANTAALQITGLSMAEIVGASAGIFSTHHEAARAVLSRAFSAGRFNDFETEIKHKDGHLTPVLFNASAFGGEDGQPKVLLLTARDLTQRKKYEEEISRAELYRILADNSTDVIVRMTPEGVCTYVSPACARVLGYPPEELMGKSLVNLLHPDDMGNYLQARKGVLDKAAKTFVFSARIATRDGGYLWVEASGKVFFSVDGRPIEVQAAIRDISEPKQAEEESRAASELIHDLYDHAPCGYHSIDADGLFIRVNDTELSWLGYSKEEMVGRMYITDIMTAKSKRIYMRKRHDAHVKNQITELIRKDGSILPALINSTAIYDEQGKLTTRRSTMYDITEQLHTEAALSKSEEQFRGLFNTMTEGVALHEVIYDESGKATDYRLTGVNPAFSALIGIPEEKAAGAMGSVLFGAETAPFLDIYSEVAETGKPAAFEAWLQPLGKHFKISVFSPQKGSFACVFDDITQRKAAEEAVKRSEEQYRLLTVNSTDIITRTDTSGNIIYISPSVERLLGYEPQELISLNAESLVHAADKVSFTIIVEQLLGRQATEAFTCRFKKKDGSSIWLENVIRPIFDDKGTFVEVQAASRDVTARKHAEEELKQAKDYAEELINTANAMVLVLDHNGTVVEFNRAGEELTGWTKAEILGRSWFETLVPRDRYPAVCTKFKHMREKGFPANFENPIMTKSGCEKHIVWHNSLLHTAGIVTGMVSFGMDVTERRQMETDLRTYKEKLDLVLKNLDAVIIQADKNGLLTLLEGRGLAKLNHTQEQLLGKTINDIFSSDPQHIEAVKKVYSGRKATAEYTQGDVVFDMIYTPNSGPDGKQDGIIGLAVDITERKLAEQSLYAEKERLKVTLQSIGDGVIATDSEGKIVLMNAVAEELTGWRSRKAIGRQFTEVFDIYNEKSGLKCANPVEKVLASGNIIGLANHTILRSANGTVRSIADSAAPILDESRRILGVILVFRDVTEAKKKEHEITFLSYHDKLTSLYNRTFFEEETRRLDTARQLPISVIMGDVNGLKLTNDVFGHVEGDNLLVRITGILRDCCRNEDIVARVGGDEFCILLPQTGYSSASDICKRIYSNCEKAEYRLPKGGAKLSISLGCATKLNEQDSITNIIKTAEDSMYRRKLLESRSQHSFLISSIRMTLFEKSYETEQHAQRLIAYSKNIAQALNLPDDQINDIELFALLHDIGKIAIDSHILTKTGKLNETEWTEMRRHPEIGFRIAQASPDLAHISEYILCHHERWDGLGYPQGLKGTAIPLLARILLVVDAYDAMTQDRVYRKALSRDKACSELLKNAGTQFDPNIVGAFMELLEHEKCMV